VGRKASSQSLIPPPHTPQAYCDVRRGRVDAALAALALTVPVEGADGEGSEAVHEWTER